MRGLGKDGRKVDHSRIAEWQNTHQAQGLTMLSYSF